MNVHDVWERHDTFVYLVALAEPAAPGSVSVRLDVHGPAGPEQTWGATVPEREYLAALDRMTRNARDWAWRVGWSVPFEVDVVDLVARARQRAGGDA